MTGSAKLIDAAERMIVRWRYDWGDGHVRGWM
jgi:hypothetical protein